MWTEINIDALVGPTHHFGGLGVGNVASQEHKHRTSHPRLAALEGLEKAEFVSKLGVPQFLFLPPTRPRLDFLSQLGFHGSSAEQFAQALELAPPALSAAFSSAFMWAANAATITPGCDALDGQTHVTPANLLSSWHRGPEAQERYTDLKRLFARVSKSEVHLPLPNLYPLRDEGAANHMRLAGAEIDSAVHIFVHGEDGTAGSEVGVRAQFLPRHTRAASEAIARRHRLSPERTFFWQQHPEAISAGVFHNDVIATSHQHVLVYHQLAYEDAAQIEVVERQFNANSTTKLVKILVTSADLPLQEAVASYFFNSQIVSPKPTIGCDQPRMVLVCPVQCKRIANARKLIDGILADSSNPIEAVHFVSLNESMANGGGPACLRLRVPTDEKSISNYDTRFQLTDKLCDRLKEVIEREYPETVSVTDFLDPRFIEQAQRATRALHAAIDS